MLFVRFVAISLIPTLAHAARESVLKQIDLPHSYYFHEMFLPQYERNYMAFYGKRFMRLRWT